MLEKVIEILQFWFGKDEADPLSRSSLWWKANPQFDNEIRECFGHIHHLAVKGDLNRWLMQPRSCLAYIILLDQFSRNMYRGTSLAFAQDSLALIASQQGREHKLDKELNLIHRLFFYMPLSHSEDLNDQKLSLALVKQLIEEAELHHPQWIDFLKGAFGFAQRHYDIILNFGRFPHRNEILERDSTQEELLFLSLPGSQF